MLHKFFFHLKKLKKLNIASRVLIILIALFLPISQTFATIDNETLKFYAKNNILYYDPTTVDCHSYQGGNGTIYGETIEEKIWVGLLTIVGLTEEQAAGAMGNMAHESTYFNPATHEQTLKNKHQPGFALDQNPEISYGLGLVQWSFQRRINMYNYVKSHDASLTTYLDNYNTYSPDYSVDGKKFVELAGDAVANSLIQYELEFLRDEFHSELANKYGKMKNFLKATTVQDSADKFLELVENPANIESTRPTRRADAEKYYNQFHGKTISGGTTSVNANTSSYILLTDHTHVTFYSSAAEENGGTPGVIASSLNGSKLAPGMAAIQSITGDTSLTFGDVIYIETTSDQTKEGSYVNGKYFIIADTGAGAGNIDIYHDPASQNTSAPFGSTNSAKIYKVASGVSWEDFQSNYYSKTSSATNTDTTGQTVTIIGDSITDAAVAYNKLSAHLPDADVDAVVGRSWQAGLSKLETMSLRDNVVFAHGSNNYAPALTQTDIDNIVNNNKLKGHNIYFITNYYSKGGSQDDAYQKNNDLFRKAAEVNSNVHVIDWRESASSNPTQYLDNDGLHPTPDGSELWSTLVSNAVKGSATASGPCGVVAANASTFQEYVLLYAWPEWHQNPFTDRMPAYAEVVAKRANKPGQYVGGSVPKNGVSGAEMIPGIDCGGWVTTLLQESGFEPNYNQNNETTGGQEQWVKNNGWTRLNPSSVIDTSILQPGDVAFTDGHTWVYVGNIPGFESNIASASFATWEGSKYQSARAPMAGKESLDYYGHNGASKQIVRWYRKGSS